MAGPDAFSGLRQSFTALASDARLEILLALREPLSLSEIRVHGGAPRDDRERLLTRQAVRAHLDALIAAGLVDSLPTDRASGPTTEYVLNHRSLFALGERVRELAALRPTVDAKARTHKVAAADGVSALTERQTPRFLVVKGLDEGRAFPLREGARLRIGRSTVNDIPLDYDPFVSSEHARVERIGAAVSVHDLVGNRNGTTVNFEPLPVGGQRVLEHGDLVGIGRSTLAFHAGRG